MKISLIVDNPLRDLPGLILLGRELAKKGHHVFLTPMNLQIHEVFSIKPNLVVVNYIRKNNETFIRNMLAGGIQVAVLDTEGGVLESMEFYRKLLPTDQKLLGKISLFCSWGVLLADYLKSQGVFRDDQVIVTGCPRYDYFHAPYKQASLKASQDYERFYDLGKPLILINTNFPMINSKYSTSEKELEFMVKEFGMKREFIQGYQEADRIALKGMLSLAKDISRDFSHCNIILRPHPFEDEIYYQRELAEEENIKVVKFGNVDGWVMRSNIVVQRNCSTAIETVLAGKMSLMPKWLPTYFKLDVVEKVSTLCNDYSQLKKLIEKSLDSRGGDFFISEEGAAIMEDWFHFLDGKSVDRVVRGLETINPSGKIDRKFLNRLAYGIPQGKKQKTISLIRRFAGLSCDFSLKELRPGADIWEKESAKAFNLENIHKYLSCLNELDSSFVQARTLEKGRDYSLTYSAKSILLY